MIHTVFFKRSGRVKNELVIAGDGDQIFVAASSNPATEARTLELFQKDRAEEYYEFEEQCQAFLAEIDKEIGRQNFSYAEYEENEQNFNKLTDWLAKIQRRDWVGGDKAAAAPGLLEDCRQALQRFADEVYRHEGGDSSGALSKN